MSAADEARKAARAARGRKMRRRPHRRRLAHFGNRVINAPAVQATIAGTVAGYLRLVNATSSLVFDPSDPYVMNASIAPVIFTMWHGQHFMLPINDRILERINGKPDSFGLPVHTITWPAYRNRYLRAADRFLENANISFNARASAG